MINSEQELLFNSHEVDVLRLFVRSAGTFLHKGWTQTNIKAACSLENS